jgi:Raf kinase inhibitor-like YbhB/YbcL family protein
MKTAYIITRYHTMLIVAALLILCFILPCAPGCKSGDMPAEEGKMTLTISSSAFNEGQNIPVKYTCKGEDVSPPLAWGQGPEGTRCFALILDDPDAPMGTFTHWVLYNLPAEARGLAENASGRGLPAAAVQGKNGAGGSGYLGPCPPPGKPHRYQFTLYALDSTLGLKAGASKKQLLEAMQGHILEQGRLTGLYKR